MRVSGIVYAGGGRAVARDADDAHEVLRILVTAHCELTEAAAEQAHQLRALLVRGNNDDRTLGRGGLGHGVLSTLASRNPPRDATNRQTVRHEEIRRLATVVTAYRDELSANRDQMMTVVNELAPGMTAQPGMGPFKAAQAILGAFRVAGPESMGT